MDLLDQLRDMRDREASVLPAPSFADHVGESSPQHELMARAVALLTEASDAALLAAYQRTDGKHGNPEVDALLAEIERRGLNR